MPLSALKTRSNALKSILQLTGRLCSDLRIGVMCLFLFVLVKTLAAAFCTVCSCFIVVLGRPVKKGVAIIYPARDKSVVKFF